MTTLLQIFAATILAGLTSLSFAQTAASFPSRAIKILVPFAPGGSSDQLARLVAQRMTSEWGQTVIVENKPGAGATLGADRESLWRQGRVNQFQRARDLQEP